MGRLQRKKSTSAVDKKEKVTVQEEIIVKKQDKKFSLLSEKIDFLFNYYKKNGDKSFLKRGVEFLAEVKKELKKVVWPSKKQAIGSSVVVIILVIIIGFFLGIVDLALTAFVSIVLR